MHVKPGLPNRLSRQAFKAGHRESLSGRQLLSMSQHWFRSLDEVRRLSAAWKEDCPAGNVRRVLWAIKTWSRLRFFRGHALLKNSLETVSLVQMCGQLRGRRALGGIARRLIQRNQDVDFLVVLKRIEVAVKRTKDAAGCWNGKHGRKSSLTSSPCRGARIKLAEIRPKTSVLGLGHGVGVGFLPPSGVAFSILPLVLQIPMPSSPQQEPRSFHGHHLNPNRQ